MDEHLEFDLMENRRGDLLLTCPSQPGEPDAPVLIVSADSSKALFKRRYQQVIPLSNIDMESAKKLRRARQITVAETDGGKIRKSYHALVTIGRL